MNSNDGNITLSTIWSFLIAKLFRFWDWKHIYSSLVNVSEPNKTLASSTKCCLPYILFALLLAFFFLFFFSFKDPQWQQMNSTNSVLVRHVPTLLLFQSDFINRKNFSVRVSELVNVSSFYLSYSMFSSSSFDNTWSSNITVVRASKRKTIVESTNSLKKIKIKQSERKI